MSLMFNHRGGISREEEVKYMNESKNTKKFWILNRRKFTPILTKKIQLEIILSSQPVQGNFNLQKCILNESKSINAKSALVGSWSKKSKCNAKSIIELNFFHFQQKIWILYEYDLYSKEKSEFPTSFSQYAELLQVFSKQNRTSLKAWFSKEDMKKLSAVNSIQRPEQESALFCKMCFHSSG